MKDQSTYIYSLDELKAAPDHIFGGALDKVSEILDVKDMEQERRIFALMVAILNAESLQQFFLHLLQNIDTHHIQRIQCTEPFSFPDNGRKFKGVNHFFNQTPQNTGSVHSLMENEYMDTLPHMGNMTALQNTLEFIERGMHDYCAALSSKTQTMTSRRNGSYISTAIHKLKSVLLLKSFFEEFLPVLTFYADLKTEQDLSSKGCAKTMHAMFGERSSFVNFYKIGGGEVKQACPLQKSFAPFINRAYLQDGNGVFYMDDTPVHGGMIMSLLPLFDDSNSLAFENNQIVARIS